MRAEDKNGIYFVFIDFERSISQSIFKSESDIELFCLLEKLYIFKGLFDFETPENVRVHVVNSKNVLLHQKVVKLFNEYFKGKDRYIENLGGTNLLKDIYKEVPASVASAVCPYEAYVEYILSKGRILQMITHNPYFSHGSKKINFTDYIMLQRFR